MKRIHENERKSIAPPAGRWGELAAAVLDGHRLMPAEGLAILRSPDDELLDLLAAAYRVRHRWFGNRVDLNFLINAKSGLCGEDCGYCSQSRVSEAAIPRYNLVTSQQLLDGARLAAERRAKTYCAVISGRAPRRGSRSARRSRPRGQDDLRPEDLLLRRPADARTGPAAEGVRRRSNQSQPEHQPAILSPDLHHALLRRPARYAPRGAPGGTGNLLGRHRRHGRRRRRRGRVGPAAGRVGSRRRAGQFSAADRRHAAGRRPPARTRAIA